MQAMQAILNQRYILQRKLPSDADNELWIAQDGREGRSFLVKIWPYQDERPSDLVRALWDHELRLIYRACSSAGADQSLMVVKDAQVDYENRAFVMVIEGCGYDSLLDVLTNRDNFPWFRINSFYHKDRRAHVWSGLARIGHALMALHLQRIIHRSLSPSSVFLDRDDGPESWRLGAFDWSVRVGGVPRYLPIQAWSTPPEITQGHSGFTFDTDWYAFGMLAARCFLGIEGLSGLTSIQLNQHVIDLLSQPQGYLSNRERHLIATLIASSPNDRLAFADDIMRQVDDVILSLRTGESLQSKNNPLRLVLDPRNTGLVDALRGIGYEPEPGYPGTAPSPDNLSHVAKMKEFIRLEMVGGSVYAIPGAQYCLLRGSRITLKLRPFRDWSTNSATWDLAFILCPALSNWYTRCCII